MQQPKGPLTGAVDARSILSHDTSVSWLVHDLLPAEGVIMLAGSAKGGKTYLAMGMALAVARGSAFLDRVTAKRKVAYVFLEDGLKRAARRFRQIGLTEWDEVDYYAVVDPKDVRPLIAEIFASEEPLLVIFDPLVVLERHLGVRDENVALEIEKVFAHLRAAAQKSGSTIVIVHHFRKGGDTMRGSVALEGSSDGWLNLFRKERSRVVTLEYTLRDGEDGELAYEVVFKDDLVRFERREISAGDHSTDDEAAAQVESRLLGLLASRHPELLAQQEIADALDLKRSQVQAALAELESKGRVVRPDGKKRGYTCLPPTRPEDLFDDAIPSETAAENGPDQCRAEAP